MSEKPTITELSPQEIEEIKQTIDARGKRNAQFLENRNTTVDQLDQLSWHQVLGFDSDQMPTEGEVKKKYKKLIREFHTDSFDHVISKLKHANLSPEQKWMIPTAESLMQQTKVITQALNRAKGEALKEIGEVAKYSRAEAELKEQIARCQTIKDLFALTHTIPDSSQKLINFKLEFLIFLHLVENIIESSVYSFQQKGEKINVEFSEFFQESKDYLGLKSKVREVLDSELEKVRQGHLKQEAEKRKRLEELERQLTDSISQAQSIQELADVTKQFLDSIDSREFRRYLENKIKQETGSTVNLFSLPFNLSSIQTDVQSYLNYQRDYYLDTIKRKLSNLPPLFNLKDKVRELVIKEVGWDIWQFDARERKQQIDVLISNIRSTESINVILDLIQGQSEHVVNSELKKKLIEQLRLFLDLERDATLEDDQKRRFMNHVLDQLNNLSEQTDSVSRPIVVAVRNQLVKLDVIPKPKSSERSHFDTDPRSELTLSEIRKKIYDAQFFSDLADALEEYANLPQNLQMASSQNLVSLLRKIDNGDFLHIYLEDDNKVESMKTLLQVVDQIGVDLTTKFELLIDERKLSYLKWQEELISTTDWNQFINITRKYPILFSESDIQTLSQLTVPQYVDTRAALGIIKQMLKIARQTSPLLRGYIADEFIPRYSRQHGIDLGRGDSQSTQDYSHRYTGTSRGYSGWQGESADTWQTGETSQKRFCTHCGAQLSPNARFCPQCGKPV